MKECSAVLRKGCAVVCVASLCRDVHCAPGWADTRVAPVDPNLVAAVERSHPHSGHCRPCLAGVACLMPLFFFSFPGFEPSSRDLMPGQGFPEEISLRRRKAIGLASAAGSVCRRAVHHVVEPLVSLAQNFGVGAHLCRFMAVAWCLLAFCVQQMARATAPLSMLARRRPSQTAARCSIRCAPPACVRVCVCQVARFCL